MIAKFSKLLIALIPISLLSISCNKEVKDVGPVAPKSVIEMAQQEPDLSLFAEATILSNVEYHLNPGATYTLLAPTDSSFSDFLNKLGLTSVAELKSHFGNEYFTQFIRYHILEGKVRTENLADGYVLTFAELNDGDRLHSYMSRTGSITSINGQAEVRSANMVSTGCVIHKLNGVLTPLCLDGLIRVNPRYSKLNEVIDFTDPRMDSVLKSSDNGYHTLLAPTDAAFNLFLNYYGYTDLTTLFGLITKDQMADALKYHIIKGKVRAEDFQNAEYKTLLAGAALNITKDTSGTIIITDDKGVALIKIISTNIVGINGVMHTIDKVLEFQ